MKYLLKIKDREEGAALIIVTIILIVAAISVPPLLNLTFTASKSADTKENRMLELHAADSGIDAAMYMITQSAYEEQEEHEATGIEALTFDMGVSYEVETTEFNECDLDVKVGKVWLPEDFGSSEYVNDGAMGTVPSLGNGTDISNEVRIVSQKTNHYEPVCIDDFEGGNDSGGEGWNSSWVISPVDPTGGDCRIIKRPDTTWAGNYHLELTTAGGNATRQGNITGYNHPYLQLKVRATDFVEGDEVYCKVSPDGVNYITAHTWEYGNDTEEGYYMPVEISLEGLYDWSTTDRIWLRFETNFSGEQVAWDNFETGYTAAWDECLLWWLGLCTGGWVQHDWTQTGGTGDQGWNIAWWHKQTRWNKQLFGAHQWFFSNNQSTSNVVNGGIADGRATPGTSNKQLQLYRNVNRGDDSFPWALRTFDISNTTHPRVSFWSKYKQFEDPVNIFTRSNMDFANFSIYDGSEWHGKWGWTDVANMSTEYQYYEFDLEDYKSNNTGIKFSANYYNNYSCFFFCFWEGNGEYFYVDDVKVFDARRFYVDDVVIANESKDAFKSEIVYTSTVTGPAFMDRLAMWLPPGISYERVIESNDIWTGNHTTPDPGNVTPYLGGTVLEWSFDPPIELSNGAGELPYTRDITLAVDGDPLGIFVWARAWPTALGPDEPDPDLCFKYFTWDASCEIFKAVSTARYPTSNHSTTVESYAIQGQLDRDWYQSFGNYAVAGNALLKDNNNNNIRETSVDGLVPSQSYCDITTIPEDAEVKAAWLYWSAFKER